MEGIPSDTLMLRHPGDISAEFFFDFFTCRSGIIAAELLGPLGTARVANHTVEPRSRNRGLHAPRL